MKKIYFVTMSSSEYQVGGAEVYLANIYDFFYNYEFIEISIRNKKIEKMIDIFKKSGKNISKANTKYIEVKPSFWSIFKMKIQNQENLENIKNHKIFISDFSFLQIMNYKFCKNNECYLVDHSGGFGASLLKSHDFWIKLLGRGVLIWRKLFFTKKYNNINIITFTKYDLECIKKHYNFKNYYAIPLFFEHDVKQNNDENKFISINEIEFSKKKYEFGFMGRFVYQKGIKTINKIAKQANINLAIAGYGKKVNKFNWKKLTNFGYLGNFEAKKEFFSQIKYFIIASKFEGLPFTMVEALRFGIPILAINTFPSIKFLLGENNERGYIFKDKKELINFLKNSQKRDDFKTWTKQSLNAQNFVSKELTKEKFINNWSQLLN